WFGLIRFQRKYSFIDLSNHFSIKYRTATEAQTKTIAEDKSTFSLSELPQLKKKFNQFLQRVNHLHKIMKQFLSKVYVNKVVWRTGIGRCVAAEPGTLTGLVWGMKAGFIGMLSTYVTLHSIPDIYVQPYFNEKKLETEFEGIFRFRIG